MMDIQLGINLQPSRLIKKTFDQYITLQGSLRKGSSVINPVIDFEMNQNLTKYNYAYIPEFQRYYFISSIESLRTGIWTITFRCDVLMSFKDDILNNSWGIIDRSGDNNLVSNYYNDSVYKEMPFKNIYINKFPKRLNPGKSCILVVGGGMNWYESDGLTGFKVTLQPSRLPIDFEE